MKRNRGKQYGILTVAMAVVLAVLRALERGLGFDSGTGLILHNLWNILTPVALAVIAAAAIVAARGFPKEKCRVGDCFRRPEKECGGLVFGAFLLVFGGILSVLSYVRREEGLLSVLLGVLGVCAGAGVLLLTRNMRRSMDDITAGPMLPVLFYGVFLVLSAYLPAGTDPILSRYWLRVLAAALQAAAFSMLAGFLRGESSLRRYAPVAAVAAAASVGAVGDAGNPMALMYLGGAVILTVSLMLMDPADSSGAERQQNIEPEAE